MSMRFDPVTGERIQEDGQNLPEHQDQASPSGTGDSGQFQQSYFYQQPEQPADTGQTGKKKKGVIFAVLAVLLVLAAGAAVWVMKSGIFSSNSAKVAEAIVNTFSDTDYLAEAFQFGTILLADESTVTFSGESQDYGMELKFLSGKTRKQMQGSVDVPGFMEVDFQAELTEEQLKVQIPSVTDYMFTYNYHEPKNGYLKDYYGDSLDDIDEMLEALYSPERQMEADTGLAKTIAEELGKLEFEKASGEEFEVDQEKRTCMGISTTVTRESLQNIFDEIEDTMLDSVEGAYGYNSYMTEYYFDDLEQSISEMKDVELTFFIYKKKLACIRAKTGEEEAELRFLGGDTRMQNMQFLTGGEELLRIKGKNGDSTEEKKVFVEGEETLSLEYNRETGGLDLDIMDIGSGGRAVITGNVFLDKDSFRASIDRMMIDGQPVDLTFGMTIKKGASFKNFEGREFDLGQASTEDIQALLVELNLL